jgi:hypothetical protein
MKTRSQSEIKYVEHIKMLHMVSEKLLSETSRMDAEKLRIIIANYEKLIKSLLDV